MKAENILNSNLKRKSTIADDFLAKIGFSKIFTSILSKKNFFERNFFKNFFIQPPKVMFKNCFKHQK